MYLMSVIFFIFSNSLRVNLTSYFLSSCSNRTNPRNESQFSMVSGPDSSSISVTYTSITFAITFKRLLDMIFFPLLLFPLIQLFHSFVLTCLSVPGDTLFIPFLLVFITTCSTLSISRCGQWHCHSSLHLDPHFTHMTN
jgi:hypothetical protein